MKHNLRLLTLTGMALLLGACQPSADTMQEAGATADARVASVAPALETTGAEVGDAASTAGAMAADAGGTVVSMAGDAGAAAQDMMNDRLTARVWEWQGTVATDGSATKSPDPAQYTLTFAAGALAVMADCKEAAGTYDADETGTMSVHVKVTTTDECGAESLADAFVDQLGQVATWQVDETALVLGMADGTTTMNFSAR